MTGKEKCRYLRELRIKIAKDNGINFTPHVCTFEGECSGTCPMCEKEIADLTNKIREKNGQGSVDNEIEECLVKEGYEKELAERRILEHRRFTNPFKLRGSVLEGDIDD